MTAQDVVFLFDVDNTLVDNDRVQNDLRKHLERESGPENRDRYWAIFEQLRTELGYADYLGALQRYRLGAMNDTRLLTISAFLVDYPFANRLYPGSLDAIEHLRRWGLTVILSDGDVVFQPRKVQRSGWLHNSFMILAGVFGWTISPATADFSASRSGQI
jgi:FMN phosphatase YigB (HAD superfamily)